MSEQEQVSKSTKTVTVGCKMPGGLILQLYEMHDEKEATPNGFRDIKVARPAGDPVRINGCAVPVGGPQPKHMVLGGYGLTPGVDADFFAKWLKQNEHSMLVKNKLIFSANSRDSAESKAEEMAKVRSNLEPLNPTFTTDKNGRIIAADPRYPKPANPNLTVPHTADRVA